MLALFPLPVRRVLRVLWVLGFPGLFCAALLSRCGRRVLVLEQGPLLGAGAVVKAPEGAGGWEFETGVQCLGGGGKLGRFVERLQLACLPGKGTPGKLVLGSG